jgi:hypothetical protein
MDMRVKPAVAKSTPHAGLMLDAGLHKRPSRTGKGRHLYALDNSVNDGANAVVNGLSPDKLLAIGTRLEKGTGLVGRRFGGGVNKVLGHASGLADNAARLARRDAILLRRTVLRMVLAKPGRACVAGTVSLILADAGRETKRSVVEGASESELHCRSGRIKQRDGQCIALTACASGAARTPPTALRAVPPPRFRGAGEKRITRSRLSPWAGANARRAAA